MTGIQSTVHTDGSLVALYTLNPVLAPVKENPAHFPVKLHYTNTLFMQRNPPLFNTGGQRRKDTSYDYNRITFLKLGAVEKKLPNEYHAVQRPGQREINAAVVKKIFLITTNVT